MTAEHQPGASGSHGRGGRGWLPSTNLSGIRHEVQDLLGTLLGEGLPGWRHEPGPRLNVVESVDAVEITADLPGYRAEEIEIDLVENHLTISVAKTTEVESQDPEKKIHRCERRREAFSRAVWLPCPVDQAQIGAELREGILTVRLPKIEPAKRTKIPVQSPPGERANPPG